MQALISGDGDTFANKAAFYNSASTPQDLEPVISLSNFIGLANLVYSNPLPTQDSPPIVVNGTSYDVIDSIDDPANSYQGMLLYDGKTNSYFVVNRGTQGRDDLITDAVMAVTTINNQWSDALALANEAKTDAAALGSTVYAVGHSLGGSLAQLQAADFGWVAYTFNAYGANDVFNNLGLTLNMNASIHNYRTLFDVVSDASTHLGNQPITLESTGDVKLLASGSSASPGDLINTIKNDHSLSNFFTPTSDTSAVNKNNGLDHVYNAANAFLTPASGQMVALAEDLVSGLAFGLKKVLNALLPGLPVGDLTEAQLAAQAWQYINDQSVSGIKSIVPVDASLLSDALNASTSNNIERASLASLSAAVLQGVDPSTLSSFTLWAPGQTTGLTKEYLVARNDMVLAMVAMAGAGQVAGGSVDAAGKNTYIYSDLSRSPSPLATANGQGGSTYDVEFANDTGDGLTASPGAYAELFGGAGNDTLFGGSVGSTLQGGAGNDDYIIDGTGTGVDYILDTDGQGEIEWKSADGSTKTLTGGDEQAGTSTWKSADGLFTYDEDLSADGSTELEIISGNKIVYVDDFTNGEFGIQLNTGSAPPTGPSNLNGLTTIVEADYTEYQDLSGHGPASMDSIYGTDATGGKFNIIDGEGNAGYIYAGDGNNEVFAYDVRYSAAHWGFTVPRNVTIQGGSGAQLLVGMGNGDETLIGGNMGQDTAAADTIDGGGANALLVSGSEDSLIFGGTGADTIVAGSATTGSGLPEPSTIAVAGLSFYGASSESAPGGGTFYVSGEPAVSISSFTDPADFQIDVALSQADGSYATPIGLLGSSMDSGLEDGTATLPGSLMIGGTGLDFLIGNSGNDTIDGGTPTHPQAGVVDEVLVGGAGADVIYGGGGTEIIFADMSAGAVSNWADLDPTAADTIYGGSGDGYIYGSGGNDVIRGGSGNYTIYTGNGNAYVVTGTGNSLVYGGNGNDTIVANGSLDSINTGGGNSYVQVVSGQSTINGGAGDDTIEADGGDALVTGGSGHVTLIAGTSTGSDTIQSAPGGLTVQLTAGLTESTLIARNVNGDLVLSDPGFDTQVTLSGYFSGGSDVSLQFADGATWGSAELLQASMTPRTDGGSDTLVGSDGSDSITAGYGDTLIVGTSGNNTLTGGAGDDTIQGGSGADTIEGGSGTTQIVGGAGLETYTFQVGDGSDSIAPNTTVAGTDTLQFGPGIDASDVTFTHIDSTNDLLIGLGLATNSTITISNFFAVDTSQHRLGALRFSDGTTFTHDQIIQQLETITGTTGDDHLNGTGGVNYFDGKGGNDFEGGNSSSDTFVFNQGYGHLEIYEDYNALESTPVLKLGAGITTSTLDVTSNGSDLYLTDGVSGDQIFLLSGLYADWGVREVQLADGTLLTKGELVQLEVDDASTSGDDMIYGSADANVYDGKGGDDTESGGGGSDTFIFNQGYGHLTIGESAVEIDLDYAGEQQSVLKLGAGITTSTLRVTADDTYLYLTDGVSGDQIALSDMFYKSSENIGVQLVQLADGTTLTQAQLLQLELAGGTPGNDTLHGSQGADLIDGKGGNDSVIGYDGNDTYVFDAGYGQLTISNSGQYGYEESVLQLGTGITASSLHVMSDGASLYITDGINGDLITLQGVVITPQTGVSKIQLFDGTQLTEDQLFQLVGVPEGTAGNDTLYGDGAAQYFDGKGGSDFESGGGGGDTFVFDTGYGNLEIDEKYYLGGPLSVLQLGTGITASTLHIAVSGNDLLLTDGTSGDQITLDEMESTGGEGVSEVKLSDGTTLTAAQLLQIANEISGTTGSDTLQGTSGADLIDGDGGSDSIVGGGGNDTFIFNAGYGHLEINETHTSGQYPVLQLGGGITASALHVTETSNNLLLTDGISGDQVTLDTMWSSTTHGVATVQLADGTTLTRSQLIQMEMTGTTGNDTLQGTSGADLIDGDGGSDSIVGGGGNDTFVFNAGYGHLEINESFTSSQQPALQLGDGITTSALHVTETNNNLLLTDGISGDQVTLDTMWSSATHGVATVQLADGTTLTRSQLIQMEMTGTTGNDTLQGTSGADLIDGGGGNDSVVGGGGNDTLVFNTGYGYLEINESFTSSQQPVLQLGAGITASTLHVAKSGNNLLLTDGVSGDQITLDSMSSSSTHGVATVQLADGTTLTRSQLIQMETIGTTGNDTLQGTSAAELIDGKGGNDSVVGGGGNDTFVFNTGYGQLVINETHTSTQAPVLQLGAGITTSTLEVTKSGSNLVLTDGVAGDQITLINMSSSSTSGVATVKFADGTSLTRSQLIQRETASVMKTPSVPLATSDNTPLFQINPLIHAIASYTGNGAGGGGMTNAVIPQTIPDVMLHAAA